MYEVTWKGFVSRRHAGRFKTKAKAVKAARRLTAKYKKQNMAVNARVRRLR